MEAGGHKVLGLPHHNGKLCPVEVDKYITEFYAGPSWDYMAAPGMVKQFDTIVKQRGVLLAKGRLLGLQFDTLFTDDLYIRIARHAINMADRIVRAMREKGYKFLIEPKTNQLFVIMENKHLEELSKTIGVEVWEKVGEEHTAVRIATSWATREEDVDVLIGQL